MVADNMEIGMLSGTNKHSKTLTSVFAFGGSGGTFQRNHTWPFVGAYLKGLQTDGKGKSHESIAGRAGGTNDCSILTIRPFDLDAARQMRGCGWDGDLEEMRLGRIG